MSTTTALGLKIALGPLLLVQGALVRKWTPKLPEPDGPREGTIGPDNAIPEAAPLRLLITGDSAGAGVGVDHQRDALLGQITSVLASDRRVDYALWARTSETSATTRAMLEAQAPRHFDVIVTSLGINDLTRDRSVAEVLADHAAMVHLFRKRFGARLIIASELPPIGRFPALPQPLRWYLGWQARRLDKALHAFYAREPDCHYHRQPVNFWDLDQSEVKGAMARDGFHPGAPVYKVWGQSIADVIRTRLASSCGT